MAEKKPRTTHNKQVSAYFKEELRKHAKRGLPKMLKYLEKVIDGKETEDQYDPKSGTIVQKRLSATTKIQAINIWQKITMDKLVGDRKDTDAVGEEYGVAEAIKDVSIKKAAARKAAIAVAGGGGKVVPITSKQDQEE